LTWWQRYERYRDAQKRKHTPGVWVVYFSLAALPLFGLGQSLIPIKEEGRRQYVFWLLVLYVGSGLGLLLTTCFLGLRRYLRQKNLRMPVAMTGAWLMTAGCWCCCCWVRRHSCRGRRRSIRSWISPFSARRIAKHRGGR
jgi:hypothetical protein